MRQKFIEISSRRIGPGEPVYIIAEISANHRQDFDRALALVEAAAQAGADAVKLQTYTPETLTIDCDNPCFRLGGDSPWAGRTLYDLYGEAFTPWEWHARLKTVADTLGIHLFSTPFDETAVDFLEGQRVPAYKIASFELTHLPLLDLVGSKGKPVILSTGTGSKQEIEEAVSALEGAGAEQIALLHCTSAYPAKPEDMNLRVIPYLAERYGIPVGLSDHTTDATTAVAAVALGACIVEKHIILSRADGGPDAAFSLETGEFEQLVKAVRETQHALGRVTFESGPAERANRVLRRSIFVVSDIRAGEPFTRKNIRVIRPGHGLPPKELDHVMGRKAARDILRGTPLSWDLIEKQGKDCR